MAGSTGKASQHHCSICVEPSELHRCGSSCAHAFCRACLAGHVRARLEWGSAGKVRCLDASCGGALDPELCRAAGLPADLFERWCAALCESMFLGARRTYCPFPDCSEMMVDDDDNDGKRVTQSECQVCRRLFCAQCGVPWHADSDCVTYRMLRSGDIGNDDRKVVKMAMEKKWKRCPKCEFFVEKADGCFHILCRCGFEFCYKCGNEWESLACKCDDDQPNEDDDDEDDDHDDDDEDEDHDDNEDNEDENHDNKDDSEDDVLEDAVLEDDGLEDAGHEDDNGDEDDDHDDDDDDDDNEDHDGDCILL